MKKVIICIALLLAACSTTVETRAPADAPIMAEPAVTPPCLAGENTSRDGIGGTGCKSVH